MADKNEFKIIEENLNKISGGRTLGDLVCPYCGGNNFMTDTLFPGTEGERTNVWCKKCFSKIDFDQTLIKQYL